MLPGIQVRECTLLLVFVMNFVIVIIVTWNPGKRMASLSKEKAKPGGSQLRYYLF